jgi:tetratricopeptide (TPR) repeat protein
VDRAAVAAVAAESPVDPHLDRAAALGLVEGGLDPATRSPRSYVSSLLKPLLEGVLSDEERHAACQRAARFLYQSWWVEAKGASEENGLEIHRLALRAGEKEIAVAVGKTIAWSWNSNARFREAVLLCEETLRLGTDYRMLLARARGEFVLGDTSAARLHYDQALALCPEVDETTTREVIKDRSSILYNLADLLTQQGDVARALTLWQESLALKERIGDVEGKAATLHQMAGVIAQQGDVARALTLWQESLALDERIGDVQGKAATLANMAGVIAQQGDVARALTLWQESLALKERIGDVQGKAATLANMAWAAGQQGDAHRQHQLNLESAAALASVRAWLDLVTVLGNLGVSEDPEAPAFLAQAFWLAVRVAVPVDDAVPLAVNLVMARGPEADVALPIAATGLFLASSRGKGPSQGSGNAGPRVPGAGRVRGGAEDRTGADRRMVHRRGPERSGPLPAGPRPRPGGGRGGSGLAVRPPAGGDDGGMIARPPPGPAVGGQVPVPGNERLGVRITARSAPRNSVSKNWRNPEWPRRW